MSDWKRRLTHDLEPILASPDPRPQISAYNNMPYAIFRYPPEEEFAVRAEVAMLRTRLEHGGKKVTTISLAECLAHALETEGEDVAAMAEQEKTIGLDPVLDTINTVLSSYQPLHELVISRMPENPDPTRDIVFITRAGALFPFYRTSALLDQMMGSVAAPGVLFYPGELDGAAGLKFMGILDPEHNYRPKIF
ncbi:MAG: BREX protein BrxB domain-containing protein [Desulfatibacillaceae bacterium]